MNKTKVIATISPSNYEEDLLKQMIKSGVDVVRFNMSYANYDFCKKVTLTVDKINNELKTNVGIMMDLEGSCLRAGTFTLGKATFKSGDKIRIYITEMLGDMTHFSVNYPGLIDDLKFHTIIKLAEGAVEMRVVEKGLDYVVCEVIKGGTVKDNSKLYIPNISLNKKFLTSQDREDILFAHKIGVDYLSVSNISNSDDVLEVNDLLIELGNNHIVLLAKLDNKNAVLDMDNIIKAADGLILSRNDIAVEMPIEDLPSIKHKVIKTCQKQGKISVISAEMTSFKEEAVEPDRAEVSDIAGAVTTGVDALMLTSETTMGSHPLEAVNSIAKVIGAAEENIDYKHFFEQTLENFTKNITNTIASSAVLGARELDCKAIIVMTNSGYTAKTMSKFRPTAPIIAIAQNVSVAKSLALYFGVYSVKMDDENFDLLTLEAKKIAAEVLNLQTGDKVIITGGFPFKKVKHTNFMKIEEI